MKSHTNYLFFIISLLFASIVMADDNNNGKFIFEMDPAITDISRIDIPGINLRDDKKISLSGIDINKLLKYDEAVRFEKTERDINKIIAKWEELKNNTEEFRDAASKKIDIWKKYMIDKKAYDVLIEKRNYAMDSDYKKLKKILDMEIISSKDKSLLVEKFLEAYGYNINNNKHYESLFSYRVLPCIKYIDNKSRWGFCAYDGSTIIDAKYDLMSTISEGLAVVKLNNKWGFVDINGNEIVPPKYDAAWSFSDGLALVQSGNKLGYIDKTGKKVISFKYKSAYPFSGGLAAVRIDNRWGYINTDGKEVIPFQYDNARPFSEGLASVWIDGHRGYINKKGEMITPTIYDDGNDFSDGLAVVEKNKMFGYIDQTGREIISLKYIWADDFSSGIAPVCIKDGCGFIDKDEKEAIPFKYQNVGKFAYGLAPVKINDKWGYIDITGKEIIPPKYDYAQPFSEGIAGVKFSERISAIRLENKWIFINTRGNMIHEASISSTDTTAQQLFNSGIVLIRINENYRFMDHFGNISF
ncbi:MAG: WG repeat-containing protein [Elusimicrobiales bacterium]|nr:WG repeat-containing protein [Elusimicrobiales bacterium]